MAFNYDEYVKKVDSEWVESHKEDFPEVPKETFDEKTDREEKEDDKIQRDILSSPSKPKLNEEERKLLEKTSSMNVMDFLRKNVGDKPIDLSGIYD